MIRILIVTALLAVAIEQSYAMPGGNGGNGSCVGGPSAGTHGTNGQSHSVGISHAPGGHGSKGGSKGGAPSPSASAAAPASASASPATGTPNGGGDICQTAHMEPWPGVVRLQRYVCD